MSDAANAGKVIDGFLILPNGNGTWGACHHTFQARRGECACGGCYARLHDALVQVRELLDDRNPDCDPSKAAAIIDRVFAQMHADGVEKRRRRRRQRATPG